MPASTFSWGLAFNVITKHTLATGWRVPAQYICMPFCGVELSILNTRFMFAPFLGSVSMRSVVFRGGRIAFRDLDIGIVSSGGRVSPRVKGGLSPKGFPLGWDLLGFQGTVHLRLCSAIVGGSTTGSASAHKRTYYLVFFKGTSST